MPHLEAPWWLLLAPLPWLIRRWLPPYRASQASVRVPFTRTIAATVSQPAAAPERANAHRLYWLVWLLLLLAVCRPVVLAPPIEIHRPVRDLVLAIDISESMATPDYELADGRRTDRLSAVKTVVERFIAQRPNDRVGLVVFGSAAFPQAPPSQDHRVITRLLAEVETGMAGPKTAIGDAIGVTLRLLAASTATDKVLIVLTDGSDNASQLAPEQAAAVAVGHNLTVHTIAVGDPAATGQAELELSVLRQIARITGGQFFLATDQRNLTKVYQTLDAITPHQVQTLSFQPRHDVFWWPLALALGLLLAVNGLGLTQEWWHHRRANRPQEHRDVH